MTQNPHRKMADAILQFLEILGWEELTMGQVVLLFFTIIHLTQNMSETKQHSKLLVPHTQNTQSRKNHRYE